MRDLQKFRDSIKKFPIMSEAVRKEWVRAGLGCPQCGNGAYLPGTHTCDDLNCLFNASHLTKDPALAQYLPIRESEDA